MSYKEANLRLKLGSIEFYQGLLGFRWVFPGFPMIIVEFRWIPVGSCCAPWGLVGFLWIPLGSVFSDMFFRGVCSVRCFWVRLSDNLFGGPEKKRSGKHR